MRRYSQLTGSRSDEALTRPPGVRLMPLVLLPRAVWTVASEEWRRSPASPLIASQAVHFRSAQVGDCLSWVRSICLGGCGLSIAGVDSADSRSRFPRPGGGAPVLPSRVEPSDPAPPLPNNPRAKRLAPSPLPMGRQRRAGRSHSRKAAWQGIAARRATGCQPIARRPSAPFSRRWRARIAAWSGVGLRRIRSARRFRWQ